MEPCNKTGISQASGYVMCLEKEDWRICWEEHPAALLPLALETSSVRREMESAMCEESQEENAVPSVRELKLWHDWTFSRTTQKNLKFDQEFI